MAAKDEISTQWTGHDLLDVNGEKIGTVEDVRYGDATGGLKWLMVKTGLFGTKKVLVPAGEVRATEHALVVPYTKDRVKEAPGVDEDELFSPEEERNVCAFYGLEYTVVVRGADRGMRRRPRLKPAPRARNRRPTLEGRRPCRDGKDLVFVFRRMVWPEGIEHPLEVAGKAAIGDELFGSHQYRDILNPSEHEHRPDNVLRWHIRADGALKLALLGQVRQGLERLDTAVGSSGRPARSVEGRLPPERTGEQRC